MKIHKKSNITGYGIWDRLIVCMPYLMETNKRFLSTTNWKEVTCKKCLQKR